MSIFQEPKKLHLITYALVWAQVLLGGVLFGACCSPLTYAIFVSLTVIGLLCVHIGKNRFTRVVTRIITGIFWAFVLILVAILAEGIAYGMTEAYTQSLLNSIAIVVGLYLCCAAPVTTAAMLFHGEHTTVYDWLMGCLIPPAQVVTAYVSLYSGVEVPWTVAGAFLPYVWLFLTAVTTLAVWVSARLRTPAQEEAVEHRRKKKEDKAAARKAK